MSHPTKTAISGYHYFVNEQFDPMGEPSYLLIIPAPADINERSLGKWANYQIVNECIADFGLNEVERLYCENGDVLVYGY